MKHPRLLHAIALAFAISYFLPAKVCCQVLGSSPFRKYATQTYNREELLNNTFFRKNLIDLEDRITNFHYYGTIAPKVIPVVFHILQSPGMPYISDSTIFRQLNQLNYDYNISGPQTNPIDPIMADYESRAFLPLIYFCLPDSIGDVSIQECIMRQDVMIPFYTVSNTMKSREDDGSDPILPSQCLNIWICNLPDSIAGFSQFPGGPGLSDGIVMSYKYLIPPSSQLNSLDYNKGKTLTHLVGNYLGVYELWNEENRCYDDYVYDTPIHNAPNNGFDISFGHVTTCPGNDPEMFINFMDNAFDSLAFMFTRGQVTRMQYVLSSNQYRGQLCNTQIVCNDSLTNIIDSVAIRKPDLSADIVKAYPNPTRGEIMIEFNMSKLLPVSIYIFDMTGKLLMKDQWQLPSNKFIKEYDISEFSQGLYYLSVRYKNETKTFPITILN